MQVASDLHLEFRGTNFRGLIRPSAPILCLLGDICACGTVNDFAVYKAFMSYIAPRFKYVFHIPGNHEYYTVGNTNVTYDDTVPGIDAKIRTFLKTLPNVFYLNNDVVRMTINAKKYVFIGTALWSYVPIKYRKKINGIMNDYNSIWVPANGKVRRYTVDDMSKLHEASVRFINRSVKKLKRNEHGILLTHHKPYLTPNIDRTLLSHAYESDIIPHITGIKRVDTVVYGHTHVADDRHINGVRVISNPKGYPSQKTLYKNNFTIKYNN
jgi:UDP-2,3-diacylglucosamine pyrophosphatase LpxH